MKVTEVKYVKTINGWCSYRCKTNIKGIEICNDGNGGATYIDGAFQNIKLLKDYTEWELEDLIDEYENGNND
jgi:hypothetical protein